MVKSYKLKCVQCTNTVGVISVEDFVTVVSNKVYCGHCGTSTTYARADNKVKELQDSEAGPTRIEKK